MNNKPHTKKNTVPNNEKATMMTLRLTSMEKDEISKRALLCKMTITDYVKESLFGKTPISIADKERTRIEAPQILKNVKNQFKSLATEYRDICKQFTVYMKLKDSNGNDMIREKNIVGYFENLISLSLSMQKILNRILSYFGQKEEHYITPYSIEKTSKKQDENDEDNLAKWTETTNEFICIKGRLIADASPYKDKKGNAKAAFTVACNSRVEGQKMRPYNVFATANEDLPSLKKGVPVIVLGTYSENEKGAKIIFAHSVSIQIQK